MDAKRIFGKSQVGTGRMNKYDCAERREGREPVIGREVMMCLPQTAAAHVGGV